MTNPFLALAMKVPAAKLAVGKLAGRIFPGLTMANDLDPEKMSHDPAIVETYEEADKALYFERAILVETLAELRVAQARDPLERRGQW